MSRESLKDLNQNLVGYTEKRGKAWWYRADLEGSEPNHYPGAIPVEDVKRRLFNWTPVEGTYETTYTDPDGKVHHFVDPTRKTILRPANPPRVFGNFKSGFKIHDYTEWLINNVEILLGGGLAVGSAGLLRHGAVAWVQIEMEDTLETPEGVEYRPHLTATTSLDGSLATTYLTGSQVIVCDNTHDVAMQDKSHMTKIRHSANSLLRVQEVQEQTGILEAVSASFEAEVKRLAQITVTNAQWDAFLEAHVQPESDSPRALTGAQVRRDALHALWTNDERVSPWANTGWGVLSAVNTYAHHIQPVRLNTVRAERNALRFLEGDTAKSDAAALATLDRILASA